MAEIDRINPIIPAVLGPRASERVQPGSDRHHRAPDDREDKLELSNEEVHVEEPEETEGAPCRTSEDGLDLSI